eukprot:TRINITY_DN1701_c0_g1_i3.p2 TRINITY_DN1701_c0_g1~~TRINITY_DN1701_c0_g1_i3.p2  ORF type:complete len:112 (+),score=24.27 TRINITY_DN1701_c0_g1_i3:42-338(+)
MPKKQAGGKGKAKPAASAESAAGKQEKVKPANHVKCRHILCEKQSKIAEAYAKLQEGQQFAQVATAYSEDKARNGGELGWMARGAFSAPCLQSVVWGC